MSVIQDLRTVSNDCRLSFEDKLHSLLEIGARILSLETGIVSSIQGKSYQIVSVHSPDKSLCEGAVFSLCDTYCADVVATDAVVAYHNIEASPGASHPCFEQYSLRSYLASPINVNGEFFGTVNFSSLSAREKPFSDIELDYLLLLASWIGNELEKQQVINKLKVQKVVLEERNSLLQQITNLAGVGTWELNVVSQTLVWSESLKKMLHVNSDKVVTPDYVIGLIQDPEDQKNYVKRFKHIAKSGEDFTYQFQIITEQGEHKWLESRAHPVMQEGRCLKIIGATMDITQQYLDKAALKRKSDIAEQALKARSEFLANMSHEIRTPIHGVQGMLEALASTALSTKQLEYTEVATKSADSLLGIVNDILDFSKIDSGNMPFENEPTDLSCVIDEQVPMFKRLAERKSLALHVNTRALHGKRFMVDKLRASQVIINLLNNAIKFTESGEIKLDARCVHYGEGQYKVKIIVVDTGIGISEYQQSLIFSPFVQAESSTHKRFGGTGLGLAIVKQIVSYYQGDITIESEIGQGSTFTVDVLLKDAMTSDVSTNEESDAIAIDAIVGDLTQFKALVVEDNEINQLVIQEQMKEVGIKTEFACNGSEALEKVKHSLDRKSAYSIILMDCNMPVMDGLEATRRIRKLGGEAQEIPILALTANALVGDKEKCLNSGMDDFISKPVGASRLKSCIYKHLSRHNESTENALKSSA